MSGGRHALSNLSHSQIDEILAIQVLVAWAGEALCVPRRLGWWRTDLVDGAGGGDLFRRLTPRAPKWAALGAVRAAAIRVERAIRTSLPDADSLQSIFHLGFEVDERLEDRLAQHRRAGQGPEESLPLGLDLDAPFNPEVFSRRIAPEPGKYEVMPRARLVSVRPDADLVHVVSQLAAALLPLSGAYPFPVAPTKTLER